MDYFLFTLLIQLNIIILCSATVLIVPHGNHNEGTSLLLACEISSFTSSATWISTGFKRECIATMCLGHDDANHQVTSNTTGIYLFIKQLTIPEEDNRNWACSINAIMKLYIVSIKIPLKSVSLTPNTTVDITDGHIQKFKCSARSRPISTFSWHIGGSSFQSTKYPSSTEITGDTITSTLYYTAQKQDENLTMYCTANQTENVVTEGVALSIFYGPREARISPSVKLYTINETDGIGPITCTADCKPVCRVTWGGPNLPISTTNVLYIENIEKIQAGNYQCTAKNDIGSVNSDQIEVVINYGPRVVYISPLMPKYTVNEFGNVGPINCTADCKPACNISWIGPTLAVGAASVINIQKINRNQTGNYYCTAENLIKRTSSVIVRVDVYYGPMMIQMEKRQVTEGNELNVTCTGQSNPPITDDEVTWTKQGNATFRRIERNLVIQHANKLDSGFYVCSVFKTLSPNIGQPVNFSGTSFVEVDIDFQCQCEKDTSTRKDDTIFKAGIASLVAGIILILLTVVWNIFFRTRLAKETGNSRSNEYAQMKSNNPAFTDTYDTVDRENPVDTGTRTGQQKQSLDNNMYEEIEQHSKTDGHTYNDLKDRDNDGKKKSE